MLGKTTFKSTMDQLRDTTLDILHARVLTNMAKPQTINEICRVALALHSPCKESFKAGL
jgi:hypothetical protein